MTQDSKMEECFDVMEMLIKYAPQVAMKRSNERATASDKAVMEISAPYKTEYTDCEITMEYGELAHLLHTAFSAGADWQINSIFT